MIIVNLVGGIGNQLFQYATASAIAKRIGTNLKLDISEFNLYKLRQYELENFNIKAEIASINEIVSILKHRKLFKKYYYKEKNSKFMSQLFSINNDAYLDGYFQSEKYFSNIENILRQELTFKNQDFLKNSEILEEIVNSKNTVSIHIRCGDYVNNPSVAKNFNICGRTYYKNAINYIKEHIKNPKFYIFSDDINKIYQYIDLDKDYEIVKSANWQEDFYFMQKCKHNIIANSTFSWWSAWLNNNQNKIIVTPNKWNNSKKLFQKNIVPNSWVKVGIR